jgi:MFS family permease
MAQASLGSRRAGNRRRGGYLQFDRNVYILLLFTLGKGFQLSIGALTINLYVYSLGYKNDQVGVVAAMSAVGALIAAVPVGLLADRMGRKPLLIVSGIFTPATLVMMALSTSLPLLILSNLLNGIVASAYWVTNLPMLTESTSDEQRVGAMALNNFLLLGVGALGALIGGEVPQIVGAITNLPANSAVPLRWGVLSAAIIVLIPALPLFAIREPRRRARANVASAVGAAVAPEEYGALAVAREIADAAPAPATAEEPATRGGTARLFIKLLLPDVLFTTGEGAVVGLLTIFLAERFFLQPGPLGILLTGAGLFGGATSLLAPRLVRRWGRLKLATGMQFASIPAILGIGFLPILPLVALAEFARQILRGVFEPVYVTFAMERVSARYRGTLSGFYSLTWSLGFSIGPIMAGFLQTNVGLSASFVIGAVLVGGSATLLRVFFPRA